MSRPLDTPGGSTPSCSGWGRCGSRLLRRLRDVGVEAIGVDFKPCRGRALQARGTLQRVGEGEDLDCIETRPLNEVRWVITRFPRRVAPRAHLVLCHACQVPFEGTLHLAGVDAVTIEPYRRRSRDEATRARLPPAGLAVPARAVLRGRPARAKRHVIC